MIRRTLSILSTGLLLACLLMSSPAIAGVSSPLKDPKGNCLMLVYDGTSLSGSKIGDLVEALKQENKTTNPECHLTILDTISKAGIEKAMDEQKDRELGALVVLQADDLSGTTSLAGVYHYAFDPIKGGHVASPEYSFKFASDSALLAICAAKALGGLDIEMASECQSGLPLPVLKKTLQLSVPESMLKDAKQAVSLGVGLAAAFKAFTEDESFSVMGVVSDKARKHADPKDLEVRLKTFIYPDRDFTKEDRQEEEARRKAMDEVVQTAKASPSGIFWFTGLDCQSPYSIVFVDTSKENGAFRREPDTAPFVSSSIGGVVRTVPGRIADYKSLPEPPEEVTGIPEATELDCVIKQATVFTGDKDAKPFIADVGIAGDRIATVGDLSAVPHKKAIDGTGLYLMPGFIDIHSHADSTVLSTPYAPSHIRQGITTVLGGNCASSTVTIGGLLGTLEKDGSPVNIGMLVGNTPIRRKVLGRRKGMFPYADLYREKELVDLAMEEGAFGMSTGLIYSTSEEAFAWELAELSRQLQPYGGFYASHIRGEADEVLDAVREAIHIGELAGVPVQISHMKVLKKHNWGKMVDYIDIMKAARERGLDVAGDQYPWEASGPAVHYRLHKLMVREAIDLDQPDVVLLEDMPGKYAKYSGKNLAELLAGEKMTPEELIKDLDLKPDSELYATYLCIGDSDIRHAMKQDFVMLCTDSSLVTPREFEPPRVLGKHPRSFRTYNRFFSHYVRDLGIVSWPLAVYKCTKLPAKRLKLDDRGVIRPGAYADIVLLDPKTVDTVADFRNQGTPPKGIEYVFINGQLALDKGEMANLRAGKPLYAYGNRKP